MLPNANTVPKLYLSVIEDLWESKVLQSKAVESFIRENNPSNFILQLPASYSKPTVVIPGAHGLQNYASKTSCASVAFSLPPGISYPVQIPAGVTLQTASGHFYKVNVPVMVTRGTQQVLSQPAPAFLPPPTLPGQTQTTKIQPPVLPPPEPELLPGSGSAVELAPPEVDAFSESPDEFSLDDIEFSPQTVVNMAPGPGATEHQSCSHDLVMDPLLQSSIPDLKLKTELSFSPLMEIPQLAGTFSQGDEQIPQLDGAADSSSESLENDDEDNEELELLGEEEILGMISSNEEEELQEEEDPLNSEDDVSDQDIPEIFDTENVIVCQYDKIHRSKNRWKFYLKDGVMCYGGKDYVFSKALGEAEW
ncbi:hypothetical protein DNTS_027658 [Danionella cerebrum]|uniref:TFIIA-alpha and beta-like factor n=1 Tax=Danionella cerebrum TaxID=2873325 RepID=A0A553QG88_9TELE|nr:hypothetical protein DNTS_027658 [Danionella translucida]